MSREHIVHLTPSKVDSGHDCVVPIAEVDTLLWAVIHRSPHPNEMQLPQGQGKIFSRCTLGS